MAYSLFILFLLVTKSKASNETDIERNCYNYQQCRENQFPYCAHRMNYVPITKMDAFCENLEEQFCLTMTQVWYIRQVSPSILNTSIAPKPVSDYSFPALGLFAFQLDEMCTKMKEQMGNGKEAISDSEDISLWMEQVEIGILAVSQYANSRLCSPRGYIGLIRCDRARVLMYQLQAFLRELPLFFAEDKRLFQMKPENNTIWEDLQCRAFYWIKHRGCYFHNCVRQTCSGIW